MPADGISSWSAARSSAISSPTRSGRTESAWPILTEGRAERNQRRPQPLAAAHAGDRAAPRREQQPARGANERARGAEALENEGRVVPREHAEHGDGPAEMPHARHAAVMARPPPVARPPCPA